MDVVTVYVTDIPEGFDLDQLKSLVETKLRNDNDLLNITWVAPLDGIVSSAELQLKNNKCTQYLINKRRSIPIIFNGERHLLNITEGDTTSRLRENEIPPLQSRHGTNEEPKNEIEEPISGHRHQNLYEDPRQSTHASTTLDAIYENTEPINQSIGPGSSLCYENHHDSLRNNHVSLRNKPPCGIRTTTSASSKRQFRFPKMANNTNTDTIVWEVQNELFVGWQMYTAEFCHKLEKQYDKYETNPSRYRYASITPNRVFDMKDMIEIDRTTGKEYPIRRLILEKDCAIAQNIIWEWKADLPTDDWKPYSAEVINYLYECFTKHMSTIDLSQDFSKFGLDYTIDSSKSMQINNQTKNQRSIRKSNLKYPYPKKSKKTQSKSLHQPSTSKITTKSNKVTDVPQVLKQFAGAVTDIPDEDCSICMGKLCEESDYKEKEQLVTEFEEVSNYSKDIIMFVKKSTNGIGPLAKLLEGVAQCEIYQRFSREKNLNGIKYKPNIQAIDENLKHNQKKFEAKCKEESRNFFEKYVSRSSNYNRDNLSSLKEENSWNEREHIVQMGLIGNIDGEVYVRWDLGSGCVAAAGNEADVEWFLAFLKANCDITEEAVHFSKQTYRAVQECNAIHQIKIAMNKCVTLTSKWKDNGEQCVVLLRGPSRFVKNEKENLTAIEERLKTHLLPKDDNLTKFLLSSLKNEASGISKGQEDVRQKVQNKFKDEDIYVSLQLRKGEVCLFFVEHEHLGRATEAFKKIFKEEIIELHQGNNQLVNSTEWMMRRKEISSGGTTKIFSNVAGNPTSIAVVGLWDEVEPNLIKVKEYFDKNKVTSTEVAVLPVVVQFFEKYLHLFKDYKAKTKDVELTFSNGKSPTIAVKGKREHLQTAIEWIENSTSKVIASLRRLREPGIPAYFRTEKGKEEIELIANGNMCIGIVDPAAEVYQPSREEERKMMVTDSERTIKNTVEMIIKTGNIVEFKSDVVVTSTSFSNLASGQGSAISKCLLKALGPEFQSMCAAAAASNRALQPGDVVSTPVINQPYSNILHVILSNYDASTGEDIIKKAVNQCLANADEECNYSIAFPCLGSGGFGFPVDKVAEWLVDAVRSFRAKYLRKAFVVVLPTEEYLLSTFQIQLDTIQHPPRQLCEPFNSLPIDVAVIQGSITSAKNDVIVNSTVQFDLTGQIGKVLVANGGQTIAHECANSPLHKSANLRITGAGTLPYQHIYHLNVPKDLSQLEDVLLELLKEANIRGVHSLAMPAVGTGNIGLPVQAVAKCIRKSIDKFEQTKPLALREISIHVFELTMVATFRDEMAKSTQTTENFSTAEVPQMGQLMSTIRTARQSADSVTVLFCSLPDKVNKAWKTLHAKVADLSISQTIESNTLQHLSTAEKDSILAPIRKRDVTIEATANKITLRGLKVAVLESQTEVLSDINRYKDAISCAEHVTWKYKDSSTRKWGQFERMANYELENSYKANKKGSKTITAVVKGEQRTYKVNFDKMNQTCSNGAIAKVKRVLFSSVLPDDWEHMEDQALRKVDLSPKSPEYQNVLTQFQQTLKINVIKIQRIQNPTVYKMFHAQMQETAARMSLKISKNPVARKLFHGTVAKSCEKICKGNFDRGFSGRNATVFGHGVYFATTASYSNGYATGDTKHIFLADVITGEYCQGDSKMRVAPEQQNGQPFDSVVDDVTNPTKFVVFKDASVYPSYLVTYTTGG